MVTLRNILLALIAGLTIWSAVSIPWDETQYWDFSRPVTSDLIHGSGRGLPEPIETARLAFFDAPLDPADVTGLDLIPQSAREDFFVQCEATLTPIVQFTGATYTTVAYECEVEGRGVELRVCRYLAWSPLGAHGVTYLDIAANRLDIVILDGETIGDGARSSSDYWFDRSGECEKY